MRRRILIATCASLIFFGCATPQAPPGRVDYGDEPHDYEKTVREYFQQSLKDPDSAEYRSISAPKQGDISRDRGLLGGGKKLTPGWLVDAEINAKNSYGGYVGFKTYTFLFRGESIVDMLDPD